MIFLCAIQLSITSQNQTFYTVQSSGVFIVFIPEKTALVNLGDPCKSLFKKRARLD